MDYAALISAILQAGGSVAGMMQGDSDRRLALDQLQAQLGELGGISVPDLSQYTQGRTELAGVSEDPRLRTLQMQALDALAGEVASGGMTAQDRLAYDRARGAAGAMDSGFRGAAEQSAAQRGMASSTGAYLGAASAGQQATNRGAEMGMQAASDARERWMKALDMLGHGASATRAQDYDVASERARAQDTINGFNSQLLQRAAQQRYQNQMGMAAARGEARGSIADMYGAAGDRAERRGAAMGAAGGDIVQGAWGGDKKESESGSRNNRSGYW